MNNYYGNYLGMVITGGEKDPEGRGRCQIFIPHIMPALYEGWNDSGNDLSFDIVGDGLPTSLDPSIIQKLQMMLPWAECAAPIVGSSPSVKDGSEETRNTAVKAGSFSVAPGAFEGAPSAAGSAYIKNTPWSAGFISYVAGTNSSSFPRAGMHTSYATAVRNNQAPGWQALNPANTQVQPGDIVIKNRGGNNLSWNSNWSGVSHGDVVIQVTGNTIKTVGGNVGDTVSLTNVAGSNGIINNSNYFAILRPPANAANNIAKTAEQEFTKWKSNNWNEKSTGALGTLSSYYAAGNLQVPPGVNPSALTGNTDTNQYPDPTKETNQWEGSSTLQSYEDSKGNSIVKNDELYNFLLNEVKTKGNFDRFKIPAGGEKYGLDGTPEGWARFYTSMAYNESGFKNGSVNATDPGGGSYGIFQIARNKAVEYYGAGYGEVFQRYGISNREYTAAEMQNPEISSRFALAISESLLSKQNIIENGQQASNGAGLSRYWAMTTFNRMKNTTEADYTDPDVVGIARSAPIIDPATPHSRNDGPDTNYQALGMFGYASEGTAVWVFFREGNPLYPVYFAASYGQREWQNMYSYSSPGIGAGVGGPLPGTEKMRMNSYGGGFESAQVTGGYDNGLDPEFTFQVYGKNGSNLLFTKDHTEFNSTYNHNQRVSGDFHEITEANKQTRVRGDKKTYVEQDVYITVGNWSEEAIAASDEIQQYINEAMEIKSRVT